MKELLERSGNELDAQRNARVSQRPVVAKQSKVIQDSFDSTLALVANENAGEQLLESLGTVQQGFVDLEGTLSVGSRAAHAELSGQLRAMIVAARQGQPPQPNSLGLLASRTYTFLANELSVPAP